MKNLELIVGIVLSICGMFWYVLYGELWYHHFIGFVAIVCFVICSIKYDSQKR